MEPIDDTSIKIDFLGDPELALDPSGRIKVTAVCYYRPERANYRHLINEDGSKTERTDEQINAMTLQDMMEDDKKNFDAGEFSLEEIMDWESEEPAVTFEVE